MPEKRDIYETQKISPAEIKMLASKTETNIRDMMGEICEALIDKGYNPINQIMGYILSGDPTYITNHRNARKIITRIGQDELLEELVRFYLYEE